MGLESQSKFGVLHRLHFTRSHRRCLEALFREGVDNSAEMGCVSSKILMRTGSCKEEVIPSFQSGSNKLEELLASKNGGDQFLALLCTANTVAKKLKIVSLPDIAPNAPIEITNSISIKIEETDDNDDTYQYRSQDLTNSKNIGDQLTGGDTYHGMSIDTINTEELLDVSEHEEGDIQQQCLDSDTADLPSIHKIEYQKFRGNLRAKSIRTIEEFDTMVERIQSKEAGEDDKSSTSNEQCSNFSSEKGWKRKAMGKELANIEVSSFEFTRIGSLRDWLIVGNQVLSPESYVTPKFGSFAVSMPKNGDNVSKEPVFDPELVSQFEETMEKLAAEEDHILKQIVEDG
ncbi:hypothetical protein J5N97_026383 [Dioscorea zingiberensis]|uniref:Uncharacterized protein n=1 Tax=Dioscorea zingiberensis TaxID=325984 RepID=A0A9D5C2Q5_9LILI|nr:hypothetical protein J5N97_026383 [Dioscorea zingiberensis]